MCSFVRKGDNYSKYSGGSLSKLRKTIHQGLSTVSDKQHTIVSLKRSPRYRTLVIQSQVQGRSWHIWETNGTPLQCSCLANPMDGGAWWAAVHEVARSQTRLSDFTFSFHFPALEKEMATHSSVLAWRIPGAGEPGGLPSMGSHRVRHD